MKDRKPILVIETQGPFSQQAADNLRASIKGVEQEYYIVILDAGMTAKIMTE